MCGLNPQPTLHICQAVLVVLLGTGRWQTRLSVVAGQARTKRAAGGTGATVQLLQGRTSFHRAAQRLTFGSSK